jgi:hypothetical protein
MTPTASASRKQEGNLIRKADRLLGNATEKELLPVLSKYFNLSLTPTERYFVFDYISATTYIELKTRRTPKAQFPTTLIGKNKIDYADTCGKDVYFVFNFSDKLCYWKYDRNDIGDKVKFGRGGRFDRGRPEVKDYAYISTDLLIDIIAEEAV